MLKKALIVLIPVISLSVYLSLPARPTPKLSASKEVVEKPVSLSLSPQKVIQGEPVLISVENLPSTTTVSSIEFDHKPLKVFQNEGKSEALLGLDLRMIKTPMILKRK